ncbi:MAG: amidohydrolase family protein [Alphaproteobacteria bacterium]|nr:amidohydrolase family protein [Alphaproteobacteria bacterium]
MPVLPTRRLWTPAGLLRDLTVELDEAGTVTGLRPTRAGDGPAASGLVVPGLVNGHTHLELSHAPQVPGGEGFVAWAGRVLRVPAPPVDPAPAAARTLVDLGTAWVHDVSGSGRTAPALRAAGLRGVVHHELLTLDRGLLPERLATARAYGPAVGPVVTRPSPHALLSTAGALVQACVASGPRQAPATIHVAETEDELAFLRAGVGPAAELLDRLGRDWRWWRPPGRGPVEHLDDLGVLGPRLLLVHGVHLDPAALRRAAARRAPLCVCARSNLHIGGRLPDVPRWLSEGGRLVLGTDSLASSPDLDVLGELPVLGRAFPRVPAERWLAAVTHEGAGALGLPGGRIVVGARPGLLELDAGTPSDLLRGPVARRWRARPSP